MNQADMPRQHGASKVKFSRLSRRQRSGLTLIEMSMVLIIITMTLTGSIIVGGMLWRDHVALRTAQAIEDIGNNVRMLRGPSGYPINLATQLIEHNLVPPPFYVRNNAIYLAGKYGVSFGTDQGDYTVVISNMEPDYCFAVVRHLTGSSMVSVSSVSSYAIAMTTATPSELRSICNTWLAMVTFSPATPP